MNLLLILALLAPPLPPITPEAQAIATCESGDTKTLGSANYTAVNVNVDGTIDTGAWQFNSYWVWSSTNRWTIITLANNVYDMSSTEFLRRYPTAADASPDVQYQMFIQLWDNGRGWQHWASSRPCWEQWLVVRKGRAVWR